MEDVREGQPQVCSHMQEIELLPYQVSMPSRQMVHPLP